MVQERSEQPFNHPRDRGRAAKLLFFFFPMSYKVAPIPQLCLPSCLFAKPGKEYWQRTRMQGRPVVSTQFSDLVTTWNSVSVGCLLR